MTVILITGASSGIGYQAAAQLAEQGHTVYGAARRVDKIQALANEGVKPLKLDVTDEASVQTAVSQIIAEQGRIDVLINNAGYGSYGTIEDVTIEEAQKQLDVNLLGVARLTQAVLPYMRKQHSGRIINTSSMGGRITTYFGAWYHATKYALEAFSDALRMEVSNFGIDVSIIEPGGIKTDWGFIAADHLAASAKGGAYEQYAEKTAAGMRKQYGSNLMSNPKIIANTMSKAVNARRPRTRYLIGMGAKPLVFLHTVLPTRVFDWMMMRAS